MKHKWHDVIIAYLSGKKIQIKTPSYGEWIDLFPFYDREFFVNFNDLQAEFRIAPTKIKVKPTKYKKVLVRMTSDSYQVINITNENTVLSLKAIRGFAKIISDWIEEEVEIEL